MPYRRLPNTDSARIRAMRNAQDMGSRQTPGELAFSQSTLMQIRTFLPVFEQAVNNQRNYQKSQIERNKKFQDVIKKTRLYLSHFIQVMNMAVARGEMKPEIREAFGLKKNDKRVPDLNTEKDLILWGKRIIEGEEARLASGASPITNPTIARVKVHFQDFMRVWQDQQHYHDIFQKAHEKVANLRKDADQLIVNLWNQIEANFEDLKPDEAREKASKYGIKYVYRKNEKLRPFLNVNYGDVS
ncbi:hypothetical protein [Salinivirga cyanobacteriivorans]|uniref:Uncharacterized protein n=1 Tax=Salinivirga cyanobacteriivorans TaxID=1307839 RepID=A0A0S2I134_9BACT|nr:hypothetical protein [Salinivirga cyanobacteriivorans]ALO15975.1 hypothetical protein L21SP5_02343 [Salinivirga cyanobacteriivorans]